MAHVTSKSWTSEQEARLRQLLQSGASAFKAAAALKRSIISVQQKARDLGMPFPHKRTVKRARWQGKKKRSGGRDGTTVGRHSYLKPRGPAGVILHPRSPARLRGKEVLPPWSHGSRHLQ